MKKVTLILFILVNVTTVFAQNSDFAGPWSLVSIDNIYPNGDRVHPYGEKPVGLLIFDEKGNYAIQILKAGRPKIASGDKNKCTPQEYAAMVQGSNSHFGTYQINREGHTISFNINHASFPNWEQTVQKRAFELKDNVLKYEVTHTTQGGQSVVAEVVWKKI